MPTTRSRFPHLVVACAAALTLTSLSPLAPGSAGEPVKVRASELTGPVDGTRDFALPGGTTHIAIHWPGQPNAEVEAAFSRDGTSFSEAVHVEIDEVGAQRDNGHTYGAVMAVEGTRAVRVITDRPLPQVTVLALDAAGRALPLGLGADAAASSAIPSVIRRSDWGADESLRYEAGEEIWPREFFPAQKLVVHHTAGRNADPNPAATVRAIYYYHAVTQEWGDIGYHYLIDEAGRVYEGRYSRDYPSGATPTADNAQRQIVEAGHARSYNAGSMGISLLGTFESQGPTAAAQRSLVRMLAWASARHGIDPRLGDTYVNPVSGLSKWTRNIAGHRDYNATACPGGVLYSRMPAIRHDVAAELVERFGGADRFATAAAVTRRFFSGAGTVVVANGLNFPDALAGGPAAAHLDAPLLLVGADLLPAATRAEVVRQKPRRILVLGGPSVVSDPVLAELAALAPEGAMRLSGVDRYQTAAAVSAAVFPTAPTVLVASGSNFPDALAGGPAAARLDAPLLLVRPHEIPAATRAELNRLKPSRIFVLGGTAAISTAVRNELDNYARDGAVRLGGADRYATAALISANIFPSGKVGFAASGTNFPDALAGGPAAARLDAPILLVRPGGVPSPTRTELGRLRPMWVPVMGGSTAVSESVLSQIRAALGIQ